MLHAFLRVYDGVPNAFGTTRGRCMVRLLIPISIFTATCMLGACSVAPQPVTGPEESSIRTAADSFIAALSAGNQEQLRACSTVDADSDTRQIANAVEEDTALSRQLQLKLKTRFGQNDKLGALVGTDEWISMYRTVASYGPVVRTGHRARIGSQTQDGVMFLRQVDGQWKVELVPTLVAESGGRQRVHDPVVEYRFQATAAASDWSLSALPKWLDRRLGWLAASALLLASGWELRRNLPPPLPPLLAPYQSRFGLLPMGPHERRFYENLDGLLDDVPSRTLFRYPLSWYTYLLLGAHNPTRFEYVLPGYHGEDHIQEVLEVLRTHDVPYIVVDREALAPDDQIFEFIREHYEPMSDAESRDSVVWRRAGPAPTKAAP